MPRRSLLSETLQSLSLDESLEIAFEEAFGAVPDEVLQDQILFDGEEDDFS